jgi:hypothetical protein
MIGRRRTLVTGIATHDHPPARPQVHRMGQCRFACGRSRASPVAHIGPQVAAAPSPSRSRRVGPRERVAWIRAQAAAVHRVAPGLRDGGPPGRGAESRNDRDGAAAVRFAVSWRIGSAVTIPRCVPDSQSRGNCPRSWLPPQRLASVVTPAPATTSLGRRTDHRAPESLRLRPTPGPMPTLNLRRPDKPLCSRSAAPRWCRSRRCRRSTSSRARSCRTRPPGRPAAAAGW